MRVRTAVVQDGKLTVDPTNAERQRRWRSNQTGKVLREVRAERRRQDAKFPDQKLRLGDLDRVNLTHEYVMLLESLRLANDMHETHGSASWGTVLMEEVLEALLEADPAKARAELVQVAAVAVRTIENIDSGDLL